jgi:hypothetical protein
LEITMATFSTITLVGVPEPLSPELRQTFDASLTLFAAALKADWSARCTREAPIDADLLHVSANAWAAWYEHLERFAMQLPYYSYAERLALRLLALAPWDVASYEDLVGTSWGVRELARAKVSCAETQAIFAKVDMLAGIYCANEAMISVCRYGKRRVAASAA